MDPLSLVASLVAVATLGFQVGKGLAQVAHAVGTASEELTQYSAEVLSLSKLFSMVSAIVNGSNARLINERSLFEDLIHTCNRVLAPLDILQRSLNTFEARFRGSRTKLTHFGAIMEWQFRTKKKLIAYRKVIRWNHSILDTLLHLVMLQSQACTVERLDSLSMWQQGIEAAVLSVEGETNNAAASRRRFMSSSHAHASTISPQEGRGFPSNKLHSRSIGAQPWPNGQVESAMILVTQSHNKDLTRLSSEEIQDIDEQISIDIEANNEDHLEEIWEDARSLVRRTLRAAKETLRGSHFNTNRPQLAHKIETSSSQDQSGQQTHGASPHMEHNELSDGWKKVAKAYEEMEKEKIVLKATIETNRAEQEEYRYRFQEMNKTLMQRNRPLSFAAWRSREITRVKALWAADPRRQEYLDLACQPEGLFLEKIAEIAASKWPLNQETPRLKEAEPPKRLQWMGSQSRQRTSQDQIPKEVAQITRPEDPMYLAWVYKAMGAHNTRSNSDGQEQRWQRVLQDLFPGDPDAEA